MISRIVVVALLMALVATVLASPYSKEADNLTHIIPALVGERMLGRHAALLKYRAGAKGEMMGSLSTYVALVHLAIRGNWQSIYESNANCSEVDRGGATWEVTTSDTATAVALVGVSISGVLLINGATILVEDSRCLDECNDVDVEQFTTKL
ncbi:unnamed protein product [Haemonchus placei]|uniref:Secreted protein n=1 Tax=Haemonchus placei TaxID=6290 RepID=A0A0N4WPG7_HAEPC|nr:unnamed protein product [Haemonchus placei]